MMLLMPLSPVWVIVMAFPRKHTRTIWLRNGQEFQWHLNPDWDWKNRWLVVTEKDKSGQLLFVDPYHYKFLPGQATIRNAIRAAFRHGWTPAKRKAPLRLSYDGTDFVPTTEDRAAQWANP